MLVSRLSNVMYTYLSYLKLQRDNSCMQIHLTLFCLNNIAQWHSSNNNINAAHHKYQKMHTSTT